MGEGGRDLNLVLTLTGLLDVEWLHVVGGSLLKFSNLHLGVILNVVGTVLLGGEKGDTDSVVVIGAEWVVHNSNFWHTLNGETDKDSDGGEVTIGEIFCSIKWINPHDRVAGVNFVEFGPDLVSINLLSHLLVEVGSLGHVGVEHVQRDQGLVNLVWRDLRLDAFEGSS